MNESLLYYVWLHRQFVSYSLKSTQGIPIEVLDTGMQNTDAGPDFFNAKIKLGDTLWVGNVEMHLNSSDWLRHGHHLDKAYDNTILHVVLCADVNVCRTDGTEIPQLELSIPLNIKNNFSKIIDSVMFIPCAARLGKVSEITVKGWKNYLLIERLEQRSESIDCLLTYTNQHWEETLYIFLARSFGFGVNSDPFEMLAKSLPLSILTKHKDNLFQIEALLFGQAGFLHDVHDEYTQLLAREYLFLKGKYNLQSIPVTLWKFLRLRPDNFPTLRLAQFAMLIYMSTKLFSKIVESKQLQQLQKMFDIGTSPYWDTHYSFHSVAPMRKKRIGLKSVHSLLINSVIPFMFAYAAKRGDDNLKDISIGLLEKLPAEKNVLVEKWEEAGLQCDNAFDSQALIYLKKYYCNQRKCLHCRIGHQVFTLKE